MINNIFSTTTKTIHLFTRFSDFLDHMLIKKLSSMYYYWPGKDVLSAFLEYYLSSGKNCEIYTLKKKEQRFATDNIRNF